MVCRKQVIELVCSRTGRSLLTGRWSRPSVAREPEAFRVSISWRAMRRHTRQTLHKVAQLVKAFIFRISCVMRNTTDGRMHRRAAECLRVDSFAGCALYEVRPAKPHERCAFDHEDDVG